jgi:hypothetical protein
MQSLQDFHGAETIISCLRYARIQLAARAQTAAWANEIETLRQKVRTATDAHDDAADERAGATAVIEAEDKELDAAVMRIARQVKDLCDGKLDDPRYLKLFRTSASAGMAPIVDDSQTLFVRTILQVVDTDDAYAAVRPAAAQAQKNLDTLLQTAAARGDLYTKEGVANANLKAACDEARLAYNKLPARLELLYGNRQALIDAHFRTLAKGKKDGVVTAAEAVQP